MSTLKTLVRLWMPYLGFECRDNNYDTDATAKTT